jgi:hypothetical protein
MGNLILKDSLDKSLLDIILGSNLLDKLAIDIRSILLILFFGCASIKIERAFESNIFSFN